jgi:serine phosphatase RsbU (regulator of sigma subunit)
MSDHRTRRTGAFKVRLVDGLSFRQASATLAIALILGLASSAYEMWSDFRIMHDQVRRTTAADLALVRGLAIEAAYELSPDLASEVAGGLSHDDAVLAARLFDNYGGLLGEVQRDRVHTPLPGLADELFGDLAQSSLPLETRSADGNTSAVGRLDMTLDSGVLFNRYLLRVEASIWTAAARAALLCAAVVAVFYVLITKPLLKITAAIAKVDPVRPGAFLIDPPPRHRHDELGLLVANANSMLEESQAGLDGRDAAERALADLNRELESRVTERTAELEREKAGVERALAQLNQANIELERANRFIGDGIRYASRIQTALLPDSGALAGVVDEAVVVWQPLDVVGGDYYWMGRYGDKAVIALMDCTGHGVPGAFMTAVVASSLSRVLQHHEHDDPSRILGHLNRMVRSALRQDRASAVSDDGLDASVCVIDGLRRTITYAGANQPLLVADGGTLTFIRGDRISLGYRDSPDEASFTAHEITYQPGTTVYMYTDGLTDHVGGPQRRLFGRRRMQQCLGEAVDAPLEQQVEELLQRIARWRGDEARRDDMTLLAFRPLSA